MQFTLLSFCPNPHYCLRPNPHYCLRQFKLSLNNCVTRRKPRDSLMTASKSIIISPTQLTGHFRSHCTHSLTNCYTVTSRVGMNCLQVEYYVLDCLYCRIFISDSPALYWRFNYNWHVHLACSLKRYRARRSQSSVSSEIINALCEISFKILISC